MAQFVACRTCPVAATGEALWCRWCLESIEPIRRQQCHWPCMQADSEFVTDIDATIEAKKIRPADGHIPPRFETGPSAIRVDFRNRRHPNDSNTKRSYPMSNINRPAEKGAS